MNSLRGISKKTDAILLMVMAGLALSLVLAWNYYQTRRLTGFEKDQFAAELLAYDLPTEAATILEESIRMQPLSDKNLKMRRALADIYMKELNQFEKALGELVFIRTFSPGNASETESDIRYCLNRLGRTYDVERRAMLDNGINPVKNEVTSAAIVRIGNKEAVTVEELKSRLQEMKISEDNIDKQKLEGIVQAMAREKLLYRAADRENLSREQAFINQVRQFESNLKLKSYLERFVFKDLQVTAADISKFISDNAAKFSMPAKVKYSCFAFGDPADAEEFIAYKQNGRISASGSVPTPDEIVASQLELAVSQLPAEIKSLDFEAASSIEFFGPGKIGEKYLVYQIHNFTKEQRIPEEQLKEYARRTVTEQKQQELLARKVSELAAKEEMKINSSVIEEAFFKKASDTKKVE